MQVTEGQRLEFKCEIVSGIPEPSTQWTGVNGEIIDPNSPGRLTIEGDTLVIDPVSPQDHGKWKCTARNVAGEDEFVFGVGFVYGKTESTYMLFQIVCLFFFSALSKVPSHVTHYITPSIGDTERRRGGEFNSVNFFFCKLPP